MAASTAYSLDGIREILTASRQASSAPPGRGLVDRLVLELPGTRNLSYGVGLPCAAVPSWMSSSKKRTPAASPSGRRGRAW